MIPRLLIIDDLFGRRHGDRANKERANLCAQYLLRDVTGDETDKAATRRILKPVAEAVFCRGQQPACAAVGDTIENDLEGTLDVVRSGLGPSFLAVTPRWALVLLDLCFTRVTVTNGER
jgi:hypothetical protein